MTYREADNKIESLLDEEFLKKLLEIGKLYGWSGDYVEIGRFINDMHQRKDIQLSDEDLEPYETTNT